MFVLKYCIDPRLAGTPVSQSYLLNESDPPCGTKCPTLIPPAVISHLAHSLAGQVSRVLATGNRSPFSPAAHTMPSPHPEGRRKFDYGEMGTKAQHQVL